MPKLVIVNGYAGAGKSTAVRRFAKNHDFVMIRQDTFLFELNAIRKPKKGLTEDEHILTVKNMMSCVKNYMAHRRNIIIEGALVSIAPGDTIDIKKFIQLGKKNGYSVKTISIVAKDSVRLQRMKKRKNIVPKKVDEMIKEAHRQIVEKVERVYTIDTTQMSRKKVLEELGSIIRA